MSLYTETSKRLLVWLCNCYTEIVQKSWYLRNIQTFELLLYFAGLILIKYKGTKCVVTDWLEFCLRQYLLVIYFSCHCLTILYYFS